MTDLLVCRSRNPVGWTKFRIKHFSIVFTSIYFLVFDLFRLKLTDFWWKNSQAIVLNMQFTQTSQFSDFTWQFHQLIVTKSQLNKQKNTLSYYWAICWWFQVFNSRFANSSNSQDQPEYARIHCHPNTRHEEFLWMTMKICIGSKRLACETLSYPSWKSFRAKRFRSSYCMINRVLQELGRHQIPEAMQWVDWLTDSKCEVWALMKLTPAVLRCDCWPNSKFPNSSNLRYQAELLKNVNKRNKEVGNF